jgi:hypothetical protein
VSPYLACTRLHTFTPASLHTLTVSVFIPGCPRLHPCTPASPHTFILRCAADNADVAWQEQLKASSSHKQCRHIVQPTAQRHAKFTFEAFAAQTSTEPPAWQTDVGGDTEAQRPAARTARSSGVIRSGTRYVKWAGGSRSQTHRRAAVGGFTQDNGYVRGVVADAQALLWILL